MLFSVKGFRNFLKRCPWICPLMLAVLVLAYGGKVICQTVSLDLEILLERPNSLYRAWSAFGRWGLILYKWIFGMWNYNAGIETGLLLLNLAAAMFSFAYLLDTLTEGKNPLGVAAFTALYLTHPVWGEQFLYMLQGAAISFAVFLMPVALMLYTDGLRGKKPVRIIAGILLGGFVFGCYQSFVIMTAVGLAGIFLFEMHRTRPKFVRGFLTGVLYVLHVPLAFLVSKAGSYVQKMLYANNSTSNYLTDQIRWGKDSADECLKVIRGFFDTVFLLKDSYFNILLPAVCILVLVLIILKFREFGNPVPALIGALAVALGPMYLVSFTATTPQYRSELTLPLTAALLSFACLMLIKIKPVRILFFIFCMYIAFLQANTFARINYTEYIRYQQDVSLSEEIIQESKDLGVTDFENTRLVIIGNRIAPLNSACEPRHPNSAVGASVYELEMISMNKANCFIRDLGVRYKMCSKGDLKTARDYANANNMPIYPAKGFVALDPESGLLIVRLS